MTSVNKRSRSLYPGLRAAFTTLIVVVAYEWAREAGVFVPGEPFQPCVMLHASLLGPIISYEENEMLGILNQVRNSQHFTFS